jgi:hypothetical protein
VYNNLMNRTQEILIIVTILVIVSAVAVVWSGAFSGQPTQHTAILLPAASTGAHYDHSLTIANATLPGGRWEVLSTEGQLPPGLSVMHMEHGCVPTEPACPQNSFDLAGTPSEAGTYTFSVLFSIGGEQVTQVYQVRVLQ